MITQPLSLSWRRNFARLTIAFSIALLLFISFFAIALAQQSSPPQTGTIKSNMTLNVRNGPGTSYGVIGRLANGSSVTILETDSTGSWYRVTSNALNGEGWVFAAYVANGAPTTNAASTAPAPVAASATSGGASAGTGSVLVPRIARLNVRNGPGTTYGVVTSVASGTAMQVISTYGDWYQVTINGAAGWVYAPLTAVSSGAPSAPLGPAPAAPSAPAPMVLAASPVAPVAPAPAAPPVPSPAGTGGFSYGIQANMWQGDKAGAAGLVSQLGFSYVKQQVRWEFAEPERGSINWQEMDDIINAMSGSGIQVLFSVVTSPPWTRPNKGGTGGPPEDFNLYANFVGQIASRYCGRLGAIEVWNEQNLQREWEGFAIDPASYMDLLRRAYSSIKAACPSIIVISGATTPAGDSPVAMDDISYLRGLYNNGLANYSDCVGIHPSGFGNPPDVSYNDVLSGGYTAESHINHRSFFFRSTLEESRAVMVQYGDTNKRLCPTEFGWASSQSPYAGYEYAGRISQSMQADYIVRAFRFMAGSGYVGIATLWNLNYHDGEMGQFAVEGRPAFDALKSMMGR